MKDDNLNYEIIRTCGEISNNGKGWAKALKVVRWSDHPAKYDIRTWSPDGEKMGKGITLTKEELIDLFDIIEEEINSKNWKD
jgi:hypothetical protein